MSEDTSTSKGWKYKLGLALFIIPFPIFFLTPIVIPMLDLSAAHTTSIIGGILIGVEVIWLASIPLLGKEGFWELKQKAFGWLKLKDKPVSRSRHRWGVILLIGSLLTDVILQVFIMVSSILLQKEEVSLLGLTFSEQTNIHMIIQIMTTLGILASLFILGGQFWEKVKQAFIWEEPIKSKKEKK